VAASGDDRNWLVCERTGAALGQLDAILRSVVAPADLQLRVMALHLIERGGKRLRPCLLMLAASYGKEFVQTRLLHAAAALELVHIASLYHDDVMDRAPRRRRGTSTNARWGNGPATVAGTYLFARANALLASLGPVPNQLASQAWVSLCAGQLQEVENAYNLELSDGEHLEILERKTATLFELPCRLGARMSGASTIHVDALATYGRYLGLAFQVVDDLLDLAGQADIVGKTTGTDLREGVYSLAVLHAVRERSGIGEHLRALLGQARLTEEEIQTALRLVGESGALAEARAIARDYARRAQRTLEVLPDGPGRLSLSRLAEHAVTRVS
jgi:heptaprenyl diphosphate synthase